MLQDQGRSNRNSTDGSISRSEASGEHTGRRPSKRKNKKAKQLAFDLSFTSQDLKNLDMTKVSPGGTLQVQVREASVDEERSLFPTKKLSTQSNASTVSVSSTRSSNAKPQKLRIPKLRFLQVKTLQKIVRDFVSQLDSTDELSEKMMIEMFSKADFVNAVFDIMDLNGDGVLEAWEFMVAFHQKNDENVAKADQELNELFKKILTSVDKVNYHQPLTSEEFLKMWSDRDVSHMLAQAVEVHTRADHTHSALKTIIETVVLLTNPWWVNKSYYHI